MFESKVNKGKAWGYPPLGANKKVPVEFISGSFISESNQVVLNEISGRVFADSLYTFPGDVVIEGNLTAEQYIVSTSIYYVTTSYSSGSTIFGNSWDDTHQFTGSVYVTGSLTSTGSVNILGDTTITGQTNVYGSIWTQYNVQANGYVQTPLLYYPGPMEIRSYYSPLQVNSNGAGINLNDNTTVTGWVSASGGFTGSLLGTASWAENAITASYALTASYSLTGGVTSFNTRTGAVTLQSTDISDLGADIISGSTQITDLGFISASYISRLPNGTVVGDTVNSTVGGTPIEIDYGVTKGDLANRFSGVKIYNYDWGGGNLAGQVEIWTDSEAQDFSTRRFYIDGFGNAHFSTNTYITGALNAPNITGSLFGTASWAENALTASYVEANAVVGLNLSQITTGSVSASVNIDSTAFQIVSESVQLLFVSNSGETVVSQLLVSGSGVNRLTVIGSGSSSPIFSVQGSLGELISVYDTLTGSLFSVNDMSGLPVIEAFSDNTVLMGSYQAPALHTSAKTLSIAGNNTIYSIPTASYDGAFFDYTIRSGSNARAGQMMAIWSGSAVNFTETVTTDFGDTTTVKMTVQISGGNLILTGSFPTANWTMKTIIRSI